MDPLYLTSITCICCESTYKTSRVRPSFKKPSGRDTDFCSHYKTDCNPDFYVVRVCPRCGFSSTENGKTSMTAAQKSLYQEMLGGRWSYRDYGGTRTREQALECYKLALLCSGIIDEKERVIAGILHHIAWLYRYENKKEQELRFLRFALDAYVAVFETESGSLNNAKLMYLMGELNRRIGEPNAAVKWFSRVVNDKRIEDASMIRACRDQWQLLREQQQFGDNFEDEPAAMNA
ncbi:DUF2225 domain-containing protein [Paenibacillus sp. CF384]|uniref:DUF2225 domain-containing protein n=1 Tax=Paenibacillus sp. CF384 TaxID=1884382 RepID=UPI00089597B2|nr:DUF2225 domain-containing protein [Paenibacillus sp. CF384]SDW46121.1 hypothetical protein SAMN05518855_1002207 [Paenibacillus sp. CF384]